MNKKENATHYIEEIIRLTSRGYGYIPNDNKEKEIIVESNNLHTALDKDRVKVRILHNNKGEVVQIIKRAKEAFVGTIKKEHGKYTFHPQDTRMYLDFVIPKNKLKGAHPEHKVLVRVTKWKEPIEVEIAEVIGKAGAHETEMRAIVFDKGLSILFPPSVEKEANAIKDAYRGNFKKEESSRRDFRDIPTFTIDPDTAKDFDDALSFRVLPNGNSEVGIHIADVTFFVKEGTELDRIAAERTTSIYLVDRTIPMLPEVLSNDLCSLNPNEDKLTFSAVFEFSPQGEVQNRWFGRTIINSQKRFSYEEAQGVLDAKSGPFAKELVSLSLISQKLRAERFRKGALSFEHEEVRFVLDQNGKPIEIIKKERIETNKIIEDFMILANTEVARFSEGKDKNIKRTFVYRVHPIPKEEKVGELVRLLEILGYSIPKGRVPTTAEGIGKLLAVVTDEAHKNIVGMAAVQSMERALYSTTNTGHFGLSLKHYTHFTSPIRRYPDMMVHRFLSHYLAGKLLSDETLKRYEALTRYTSEMERVADEAQWASIKYKHVEYMAERIGKIYEGMITGFTEKGIFVREKSTLAEGMVRLRDIKDDYYVYNKEQKSVLGERTKKKYTLGDTVKIKVLHADVEKRFIDYAIIQSS